MALSGHSKCFDECPLSGVKRTFRFDAGMSAITSRREQNAGRLVLCGGLACEKRASWLRSLWTLARRAG